MTERPLRVVLVAETALPYVSGVTVATDALARGLGAAGHEVLLLAPRPARAAAAPDAGTTGPPPRVAWLPSLQLPPPAPRGYRIPLPIGGGAAMRAARGFRPDVVHVQSPFGAGRRGARIARQLDVPLVFTHHTRFDDYAHYLGPAAALSAVALRRAVAAFWRRCDAIIAPGADLGAEIAAGLSRGAQPLVRVIPTGVDVAAIRAIPPLDVRSAAGWAANVPVVATLGRLAPEKSVDEILEAVARVPEVHLAVIGDGPSGAALRGRAARRDLAARTWFFGALPRPRALAVVRGADLFVFASRTETQGLVVAEALAAGLPVVGVSAPGIRDAVRDGTDGLLVTAGTAADRVDRLAGAIAKLALDEPLRARLAAAAARGAHRLSGDARVGEVVALYRELIRRGRHGR